MTLGAPARGEGLAMIRWRLAFAAAAAFGVVASAATWGVAGEAPPRSSAVELGTNGPPLKPTVGGLAAICDVNGSDPQSWCAAYLLGALEAMQAFGAGGHKAGTCGVTYTAERLAPIFVAWSKRNPDFVGFPMMAGVNLAFREAWPCH